MSYDPDFIEDNYRDAERDEPEPAQCVVCDAQLDNDEQDGRSSDLQGRCSVCAYQKARERGAGERELAVRLTRLVEDIRTLDAPYAAAVAEDLFKAGEQFARTQQRALEKRLAKVGK